MYFNTTRVKNQVFNNFYRFRCNRTGDFKHYIWKHFLSDDHSYTTQKDKMNYSRSFIQFNFVLFAVNESYFNIWEFLWLFLIISLKNHKAHKDTYFQKKLITCVVNIKAVIVHLFLLRQTILFHHVFLFWESYGQFKHPILRQIVLFLLVFLLALEPSVNLGCLHNLLNRLIW